MSREESLKIAKVNLEEALRLIRKWKGSDKRIASLEQLLINPYTFILHEWGTQENIESKIKRGAQ